MNSDKYIKQTQTEMKNTKLGDIREIEGKLYIVDYWYYYYIGLKKLSKFSILWLRLKKFFCYTLLCAFLIAS